MLNFGLSRADDSVWRALLLWFRRCYKFHELKNVAFTLLIAFGIFVIWIVPEQIFNFPPRNVGFDPSLLTSNTANYWLSVTLRFLRLVVVVPVMEEIFLAHLPAALCDRRTLRAGTVRQI